MNTAALREQIKRAQQHEADTGHLLHQLEQQLPNLHPTIALNKGDAHTVLKNFISAYIEHVPDLLDAAHSVALEAGIEAQIKPVLRIASQFFSSPPAIMNGHEGLDSLLDEAYLAHRLVGTFPDARLVEFPDALTFVSLDQPARLAEEIDGFAAS